MPPVLLEETRSPRCSVHRAAASGWRCDACGRWLCERCTVEKQLAGTRVEACAACGGPVEEVRVRRVTPAFPRLVADAVRYPFTDSGKPYLMTVLVLWWLGLMWWPGRLGGMVVLAGVTFEAVRATGRGEKVFPGFHDLPEFFTMLRQGLAAALPFLLWLGVVQVALKLPGVPDRFDDPARWVVLGLAGAVGAAWAASAFVFVAVGTSLVGVVNPVSALSLWAKAGAKLVPSTAVFGVSFAAWVALQLAGDVLVDRWRIWIVPHLLLEPFRVFVALAGARAVGWMLYVHGGDAGYGTRAEWYSPALGATRPHKTVDVQVEVPEEQLPPQPESIELPAGGLAPREFVTFQPTDPGASIDLGEDAGAPPAWEDNDALAHSGAATADRPEELTEPSPDEAVAPGFEPPVVARATKPAVPDEDLVSEEEFLRSVGVDPASVHRKAE